MLKSNSLFLDSEYKVDCEHKINYLKFDFSENKLHPTKEEISKDTHTLIEALSDGVVNTEGEDYSYADDGTYVYPVRKITADYSKIIVELPEIPPKTPSENE